MSNYLFLSWCTWGHIDFGGFGFLKTGVELVRRGHNVYWLFTDTKFNKQLVEYIRGFGIKVIDINHKPLSLSGFNKDRNQISNCIDIAAKTVTKYRIDLIVSDRTVALSGLVAEKAGIPYASIGTDGRKWCRLQTGQGKPYVVQQKDSNFVNEDLWAWIGLADKFDERLSSDWLVSPFLNISFFPKVFYEDKGIGRIDYPSHFVGNNIKYQDIKPKRNVLLTLGNSFHPSAAEFICEILHELIIENDESFKNRKILCLTGNVEKTQMLNNKYRRNSLLHFITWEDYGRAFSESILAIGHGGNSFTWECINANVPSLVIAPHISDQIFNSKQSTRLGISRTIKLENLNIDNVKKQASELLNNASVKKSLSRIYSQFYLGGGVWACANLLESLSVQKAPINESKKGPCCC